MRKEICCFLLGSDRTVSRIDVYIAESNPLSSMDTVFHYTAMEHRIDESKIAQDSENGRCRICTSQPLVDVQFR